MSKAEERALECIPTHPNEGLEKQRKRFRKFYVSGYEQAEKDLMLTWEDIRTIGILLDDEFRKKSLLSAQGKITSLEHTYKETLRRFNEQKNK